MSSLPSGAADYSFEITEGGWVRDYAPTILAFGRNAHRNDIFGECLRSIFMLA